MTISSSVKSDYSAGVSQRPVHPPGLCPLDEDEGALGFLLGALPNWGLQC